MTYHIKIFFKSVLRDVFFVLLRFAMLHSCNSLPTDDREAEQAHRRVSNGQSRSKCAARVCIANIEIIV